MKRNHFSLFFLLLVYSPLHSQFSKISLEGITGIHIFSPPLGPLSSNPLIFSTPFIGIGVSHENVPLKMEFYRTSTYKISGLDFSLREASEFYNKNYLDFIYKKPLWRWLDLYPGVGYFNYWRVNLANDFFGKTPVFHGYSLTSNVNTGDLRVQFRYEMVLHPWDYSTAFEREHFNISFQYFLNFEKNKQKESRKRNIHGYFLLGLRAFPVTKKPQATKEAYDWIGLSPHFGVEFLSKKYKLSFNLERDVWVKPTAGHDTKILLEYTSTSLLGIRYHLKREGGKTLKFGLGGAFIIDLGKGYRLGPSYLQFFNVKGLAASFSYPIYRNLDIEARQVLPVAGDSFFKPMNFSLAAVYRLRSFDF